MDLACRPSLRRPKLAHRPPRPAANALPIIGSRASPLRLRRGSPPPSRSVVDSSSPGQLPPVQTDDPSSIPTPLPSLFLNPERSLSASSRADARDLAVALAAAADAGHALDVRVLDVSARFWWTSFVVLATVRSRPQAAAVLARMDAAAEAQEARAQRPRRPPTVWEAADYGQVVAHVLSADTRQHYALEELWDWAEEVPVEAGAPKRDERQQDSKARRVEWMVEDAAVGERVDEPPEIDPGHDLDITPADVRLGASMVEGDGLPD